MPQQRYEEIFETLRARIADGTYPPGSKLPSRAQLGTEFNVSDNVIGKSMMLLRATGRVETLEGVGVYVKK